MTRPKSVLRCALALLVLLPAMAAARSHKPGPAKEEGSFYAETGRASWYGHWHNGMMAADGSSFDPDDFTAAHRTLKFGTIVQVTNLRNHRMVKVRITDRGPHSPGRIIDVSAAAARELGMQHRGVARVRVRAFRYDQFPD